MPFQSQRAAVIERCALVVAFVLVHAVLALTAHSAPNLPVGDVSITYARWVAEGRAGSWVGIDTSFVYPILALVPMVVADSFGLPIVDGWLLLMTASDAVAVAFLWPYRVRGVRVVWWWLLFLLALGPIGVGRIDTVATVLALVGVAVVARRPGIASALFTVAAWVKVWPAALVGVLALLRRHHRGRVVAGAVVVTACVVAIDAVLGGGTHLLSFVGQQTGRALQIESPLATPFMWQAWGHADGAGVYYDTKILTFEISGRGTAAAADWSTPIMVVLAFVGVALAWLAARRGMRRTEIMPMLALAFVATLIVGNKVGSPQYVGWFAVPVVWGFVAGRGSARRFVSPAILSVVIAALTQCIYPWYYDRVLTLDTAMLVVLTLRNVAEVGLLVWALVGLWQLGRGAQRMTPNGRRDADASASASGGGGGGGGGGGTIGA